MNISINGIRQRLPIVRIDGKDYFLMGGTYSRLDNEKIITERYTPGGEADRQILVTGKSRWKFTIMAPFSASYVTYDIGGFAFGDLASLHTSAEKVPPNDLLDYYDISALENFGGSRTQQVYMKIEWEVPDRDDPGIWQVPTELWGY